MNSIHIRALVSQEGCIELRIPQQYHGKMLDLVVVYEPVQEAINGQTAKAAGWPPGLYEATAGAWQGKSLVRESQGNYEERDLLS